MSKTGWLPYVVGCVLVVLTRIWMSHVMPTAFEDAYITFRYARNLVHGLGLVFNPGETVYGITSIPWALWSAVGIGLLGEPVLWARASNILLDCLTLVTVVWMLRKHVSDLSAWCFGMGFALWPFFSALSVSGMEMSATLALLSVSVFAVTEGCWWSPVVVALLGFIRPECVVPAAIIGWNDTKQRRGMALMLYAAMVGGAWAYYGQPLPQSLFAKASVYGTHMAWNAPYWWEWFLPIEHGAYPAQQESVLLYSLRILLFPAFLLGVKAVWKKPLGMLLLASGAVWAMYALAGTAYFFWYMALPVYCLFLGSALGLPRMTRSWGIYGSLGAILATSWWLQTTHVYNMRAEAQERVIESVAYHMGDGDAFMEPIGFVGWVNPDMVLHDEVGLVTPEIVKGRKHGGWYSDYVDLHHPRWLAVRRMVFDGDTFNGDTGPFHSPEDMERVFSHYKAVYAVSDNPMPTDIIVFRRNE